MVNRRRFMQSIGVMGAASSLVACSDKPPSERYNDEDIALLAQQRLDEARLSGKGRFGAHRYQGYRGLAALPWFELDDQGVLQCVDQSIPQAIDMHAHLGMSVLFKPTLDLQASSPRVQHLLDCDGDDQTSACELDLDIYVNGNFSEPALEKLESTIMAQGLWGSGVTRTHTIANLLAEMDAMRVEKAAILPIKLDLPFGDNQTEQWRSAISKANKTSRLLAGFSVHPLQSDCIEQMREHAKQGFKLMKLHPTVQKFYPDDPAIYKVYEEAASLGVSIFFHGGRAGIEPESSHRYAMPRHYQKPIADFPSVQFVLGHAGARDVDAMLELMLANRNAWLGTHGQGISKLDTIIQRSSDDGAAAQRIVFGTDWPFYHLGASLAKALIVTEAANRRSVRQALLRDNAQNLINLIDA